MRRWLAALTLASLAGLGQGQEVSQEVRLSTVTATIRVVTAGGGQGSGVLLKVKGNQTWALTAAHVVKGADEVTIEIYTPRTYPKPTKTYRGVTVVARSDGIKDLALLSWRTTDVLPAGLSLCPASQVPGGGKFAALTVGCSEGGPPAPLEEQVTGAKHLRRQGEKEAGLFWEIAQPNNAGRSGGPLVNRIGQLLGLASGNSGGKSYYTHVEEIRTFLKGSGQPVLE